MTSTRPLMFLALALVLGATGCGDAGGATTTDVGGSDGAQADVGSTDLDSATGDLDSGTGDVDSGGIDVDSGTVDSGGGDVDAALVCDGVHPIVGPPRTCDRGRCLCADPDACFPVDVAAACCGGDVTCAPPVASCTATHPIIGPPRTCESGNCYCSNPDACFPAEVAAGCCAVDVVCVP